jgi:release factor glutamine methyltransferase
MNEAELLFTQVLGCDRLSLYLEPKRRLSRDEGASVSSVLERRIKGEPIQYILGKTEFMGLEFKINPGVFIPRPETEILVEVVIKYLPLVVRGSPLVNILELGTGSGCVAVSLAKLIPDAKITATDISQAAIDLAKENAILHKVEKTINFLHLDLITSCQLPITNYHLIISNPPYIPTDEIEKLQPEIQYEPRLALDGGRDGLDFYRRVIAQASPYLKTGGFLIMEIGDGQLAAVRDIFGHAQGLGIQEAVKDYNNIDRVIVAQRKV